MSKCKGWKAILRDVVIIRLFIAMEGFIIGVATTITGRSTASLVAVGLSDIFLGSMGFYISGCMIKGQRWKHLVIVALLVWLTSIINTFFRSISLIQWLISIIVILIMMAVGGGLSFIFKKPSKDQVIIS